jgi:hypothetical protein
MFIVVNVRVDFYTVLYTLCFIGSHSNNQSDQGLEREGLKVLIIVLVPNNRNIWIYSGNYCYIDEL